MPGPGWQRCRECRALYGVRNSETEEGIQDQQAGFKQESVSGRVRTAAGSDECLRASQPDLEGNVLSLIVGCQAAGPTEAPISD